MLQLVEEPNPNPVPNPNPNFNPTTYYYYLLLYLGVLQLVEQDIRWLNVAVQHRVAVQVGDPLRGLVGEPPARGPLYIRIAVLGG